MKKKSSVIVSLVIISAVILTVGIISSFQSPKDQNLSFSIPVMVSDKEDALDPYLDFFPEEVREDPAFKAADIEFYDELGRKLISTDSLNLCQVDSDLIRFDPVGSKVQVTITASSNNGLATYAVIYSGQSYKNQSGMNLGSKDSCTLQLNDVDGQEIYLSLTPFTTYYLLPGEYSVDYKVTVHPLDTSSISVSTLLISGAFLLFAAFLIIMSIRDSKEYDERQLANRGQAAMISFIVSIICCFSIAVISKCSPDFPLSAFESTIIPTIAGLTTFAIVCDYNDAFIGYNGKRTLFVFFAWIMTILTLASAFVPFIGTKDIHDLSKPALIVATSFLAFAIEITIKNVKEKRGEALNEES